MLTETQDMEPRLLRHAGLWPYSAGHSKSCGARLRSPHTGHVCEE
jgi:hypothetical protein